MSLFLLKLIVYTDGIDCYFYTCLHDILIMSSSLPLHYSFPYNPFNFVSLSLSSLLALLLLLSSFPSSSSLFPLKINQTNNKAIAASVQAFRLIPCLAQWKDLTRSWFKGLNIVKISSLLFPSSSLLPLCLCSLLSRLFSCTS